VWGWPVDSDESVVRHWHGFVRVRVQHGVQSYRPVPGTSPDVVLYSPQAGADWVNVQTKQHAAPRVVYTLGATEPAMIADAADLARLWEDTVITLSVGTAFWWVIRGEDDRVVDVFVDPIRNPACAHPVPLVVIPEPGTPDDSSTPPDSGVRDD
jgi:hypothetical protein